MKFNNIVYIIIILIISIPLLYFYYNNVISPKSSPSFSQILSDIKYNSYNNVNSYNIIFLYSYDYLNLPKYSDYSIKCILYYCELYNYTLMQINHYGENNISPYWLRVYDLIDLSQKYDDKTIFIYLDLDTILNPKYFYIKIENLLNSIDKTDNINYDIYISTDRWPNLNINTGVIFVKNTNYSKKLLKKWSNYYQPKKWKYSNNKWTCYNDLNIQCLILGIGKEYEQGALEHIYINNIYDTKIHIKILDNNISSCTNYNEDAFIYHFMGQNNTDRLKYMKKIYYRNDKFITNK